jgi:chemotaxis protein methyltransferase CheR
MDPAVTAAGADRRDLSALLDAIYRVYHHDFRSYAESSLRRRVETSLVHLRCETIDDLRDRVVRDPAAFGELLRFLTVQVSDMFRDPVYYRALRESVVPYLATYPALKVWVAGCATGEEAYSLAIVLLEAGLLDRALIYATDIDPECLRIARAGVYATDRLAGFSDSYQLAGGRASLADYYAAAYGGALLDRRLRKAIVFSDHSLATDGAFAEVQLVSCRNVLIYFDDALRDRALAVLRESLCPGGFLGLGLRETLKFSAHASAFSDTFPAARIYRKAR